MKRFLFLILSLCGVALSAAKAPVVYTPRDFRKLTSTTAAILERNHYSGVVMSRALSAKIFDHFLNSLDPSHIFLSQEDIAPFLKEREQLGFKLQNGEYELAFAIFDVYRRNFNAYCKFAKNMLASKIDFTVDESLVIDRKSLPRPRNLQAMQELWRRKIKNDLLVYRLMERADRAAGNKSNVKRPDPVKRILQRLRDAANDINQKDRIDILGIMLNAMAESYGAHSGYNPPKLSEDFDIHMSLSLTGIGATLTSEDGYIKVVELVAGGPAAKSGRIKVNDRIVAVTQQNGEHTDLIDMPVSKAVQFIRGEKGTRLTLDILPANSSNIVQVTLVRDTIKLEESAAKGVIRRVKNPDGRGELKIGVLTLPSFYMDFGRAVKGDSTARRASVDVRRILTKFNREKVDAVVMDLRNNGGGSLPDAIELTGLFLTGEPVVTVCGRKDRSVERDPDRAALYSGPLVVLSNKMSASAAEIFIGALRDSRRAVVVGDSRTFGKGTVLTVNSLDETSAWFGVTKKLGTLTYEIAMFYRPGGSSVQQLGIAPDILLPSMTEELEIGEMFMDNHLPWDWIDPVRTSSVDENRFASRLEWLRSRSSARIKANPEYMAFIRQIEIFRRFRNRKEVTLCEERRWVEYQQEREAAKNAEKAASGNRKDRENKENKADFVLTEAVNIAADLCVAGRSGR